MNHGAGTAQLANLVGNAPLPTLSLLAPAREPADKVAGDANYNPDKRDGGEINQAHPSTLRTPDHSAASKFINIINF